MRFRNKLIVSGVLFISLMIILTLFSVYHTEHLGGMYPEFVFFLYGTSILSLSLGGFIVYLFQKKIEMKEFEKYLILLPQDESKILKILYSKDEITQNSLVSNSGLSNVKVSRILKTLENKGLIKKKKSGYTNLIILK